MLYRLCFIVCLFPLFSTTTWGAAPVVVPIGLADKTVREHDSVGFAVSATDPDGDALSYVWSIENDPTGKATIVKAENNAATVGVTAGSNFPNPSFAGLVVTFKVDVKDAVNTVTTRFRVTVQGVNRPPNLVINEIIGTPGKPRVPGEFIGFDATKSSDPDGTEVKFLWIIESASGARPCEAALVLFGHYSDRPGLTVPELTGAMTIGFYMLVEDGLYKIERRFTGYMLDSTPCGSSSQTNRPPVVSASASPQNPKYGQTVTLTGNASDPDGDALSYSWLQKGATGGNVVTLSSSNSLATSFTAPGQDKVLTFEFKATDSKNASGAATLQISVTRDGGLVSSGDNLELLNCSLSGNQPALANAGPDKTVNAGETVILVGSGSDPDNSATVVGGLAVSGVTHKWEVFDGKGLQMTLQNAATSTVTFVAPQVSQDTTIVLALTVKDVFDCGSRDKVNVTIKTLISGKKPTANAGPDQTVSKGQTVTLTGGGTHPDNDTLSFAWSQVLPQQPTIFFIGQNKATTSFVAPNVTQDTDFVFRLTVTDTKGASAADDVKVTVKKNNAPQLSVGSNQTVNSGTTVTLTATASDADGDSLTYLWTQVSGLPVAIANDKSVSASLQAPNVETVSELVFKVTVSDAVSSVEATIKITVNPLKLNSLVFPYASQSQNPFFKDTFVGVAIVNSAGNANNVVISGVDSNGVEKSSFQLSSALPAQGQNALLSTEISSAGGVASLVATGKQGPIQGFFMMGGPGLKKLDGIGGELKESKLLYFPLARQTSTEATLLFLFNTGAQNDPNVTLKLFNKDGVLEKSRSIAIPAQGSFMGTLDILFGNDTAISEGYIQVTGNVLLKGFEFLGRAEEFSSLPAQIGIQSKLLYLPHFFVDNQGGNTELRLLNIGENKTFVKIKAFNDLFTSLGTKDIEIEPNKLFVGDLKQLLNLDTSNFKEFEAIVGHLTLELVAGTVGIFQRTPTVIGSVTFSGNRGKFLSTIPFQETGLKETLFLQVAQEATVFTGLAILNPGTSTTKVKVQVFDEKGAKTGESNFDLPAGNRVVDLLDGPKFFRTGFKQIKGHIRVSSDQPVIAFALFGDTSSEWLAAIEGQAPVQ